MTLRHMFKLWDKFLFQPVSSLNIAIFRIVFGFLSFLNAAMMFPDRRHWFGIDSVLGTGQFSTPGQLNILTPFSASSGGLDLWFGALILISFFVIIGFFTRISLVILWMMIVSMHHANILILHSGDTLLRIISFFMIFTPAGACLSVDSLRKRNGLFYAPLCAPWAQRILQIQLCIVYFATVYWKLKGSAWNDGTAVGNVLNLLEFKRFPIPDFMRSAAASELLTGATAVFEMSFPVLVWFKDTRKLALLVGLCFHLGIEWSMNIQLFQPTILSLYLLFVSPESLRQLLQKVFSLVATTPATLDRKGMTGA